MSHEAFTGIDLPSLFGPKSKLQTKQYQNAGVWGQHRENTMTSLTLATLPLAYFGRGKFKMKSLVSILAIRAS